MAHRSPSTSEPTRYTRPRYRRNFEIAIICALPLEYDAVTLLVDEFWDLNNQQYGRAAGDKNTYRNGRIGPHHVVLMLLPSMGTASVAGSAASLRTSYPALQIAFLVGICGGSPAIQDAFLGDVVIGDGVVQYLLGRQYPGGFVTKTALEGNVHVPSREVKSFIAYFKTESARSELLARSAHHLDLLQTQALAKGYRSDYSFPGIHEDRLFVATYPHKHRGPPSCNSCSEGSDLCEEAARTSCSDLGCDERNLVQRKNPRHRQGPDIFIGLVGSGDTVMKSAQHRDKIARQHNVIAFEMEGAGLQDEIPSIVIKGICDYSDSHKNKSWQSYAAATAAAVTKAVLERYSVSDNAHERTSLDRDNIEHAPVTEGTNTNVNTALLAKEKNPSKDATSSALAKMKKVDSWWTLENALQSFEEALDESQRGELHSIQTVPDSDAVLIFTAELDHLNRSRKGASIASRLFAVLQSARDFASVVDNFATTRSKLSFLVWGSIKVTILLAFSSVQYYEAFSEVFMKIGRLCPSSRDYYKLFWDSVAVQMSLCNFFASLIRCCNDCLTQIAKVGPARANFRKFRDSVLEEISPQIDDIQRCSEHFQQVLFQVSEMDRTHHLQEKENQGPSHQISKNQMTSRRSFRWPGSKSASEAEERRIAKRQRQEYIQELLESLSSHNFLTPLRRSRSKRTSGTGEWLLNTYEFHQWIKGDGLPVLWCSGKIGSGKSILTASLIDKVLMEKRGSDTFVSFFFVEFNSQQPLQSTTILKCIIKQILNQADVSEDELAFLENIQNELESRPKELIKLVRMIISRLKKLYIIIDGLDECEKVDRDELMEAFLSLLKSASNVFVFFACRDSVYRQAKRAFEGLYYHISTGALMTQLDINTYIEYTITKRLRWENLNVESPKLVDEIKEALKKGANGMFFWVALQIEQICAEHHDDRIRMVIRTLPRDLTETFDRALFRIISRNNTTVAQRFFHLVAAAQRSLSIAEIKEVFFVEINQSHSKPERNLNDAHLVSSWCENLVVFDEEENIVQFAHHSVQEHLTHKAHNQLLGVFHFQLDEASHFLGEICITYLNFGDFITTLAKIDELKQSQPSLPRILPSDLARGALGSTWRSRVPMHALRKFMPASSAKTKSIFDFIGSLDSVLEDPVAPMISLKREHPFLEYASSYWLHHTRQFQVKKSKTWDLWKGMIRFGHNLAEFPWTPTSLAEYFPPSESEGGHNIINLLRNRKDFAPVNWACTTQHSALIWLLSRMFSNHDEHHLDMELISNSIATGDPFVLDSILSASDKVESLLKYPVMLFHDLMWEDSALPRGSLTALQLAAFKGDPQIIEMLLAAGASISSTESRPTLSIASENGWTDAVSLLIKVGAKVNAPLHPAEDKITSLHLAAYGGHAEVCRLLLKKGASVDVYTSPRRGGFTPLHLAVLQRKPDTVRALLNARANPNALTNGWDWESTAHELASFGIPDSHHKAEIIELIIKAGGKNRSNKNLHVNREFPGSTHESDLANFLKYKNT